MAKTISCIKGSSGYGLLQGIHIEGVDPNQLCDTAMKKGLLVLRSGTNKIRIAPPLIISTDEIDKGMAIIAEALKELS